MLKLRDKTPIHSHNGECWRTNSSNKKRLVDDFNHRCAYCDDHDHYSGGYNTYHVDHFAPKNKFKELEFVYQNLMYCCPYCNSAKKDKWIGMNSTASVINNEGFVNPCTDEYAEHLFRDNEGNIKPKTEIGEYMYRELKLYLCRHRIIYQLDKIRLIKKKLKEIIDLKKKKGENIKKMESIYHELCVVFSEYYDVFFQETT
jgi:hypothetical protein